MRLRYKILTAVLTFLGLAVLGGALVAIHKSTDAPQTTNTDTNQSTKPPATAKHWFKITSLAGNAPKQSLLFKLITGQIRITYTISGGDYASLTVYVVPKGQTVASLSLPDVDTVSAQNKTVTLSKNPGQYYLATDSKYATWSVTLEELR